MKLSSCRWIEHALVPGVRAISTLRGGAADDFGWRAAPDARLQLMRELGDPMTPVWLRQVHGSRCIDLDRSVDDEPVADAALTRTPGRAAVVQTADCLPVLLAARDGSVVAAVHAGWRSLVGGILTATVQQMDVEPGALVGLFGPAIGPAAFEVGPEVRAAFIEREPLLITCFDRGRADRWHADLYRIAQLLLVTLGVPPPRLPVWCTRDDPRFHSWRRDGSGSGRMAHLVWREPT